MKKMKHVLTALLFFVGMGLFAQQGTTASGGEASGSRGTANYSVGQAFYNESTSESGSMVEGVQQPYEISVINGVNQQGIDLQMSAYPNPTIDYLLLNVADVEFVESIALFDSDGRRVWYGTPSGIETKIEMADMKQGAYFLKAFSQSIAVKTFKIIKY